MIRCRIVRHRWLAFVLLLLMPHAGCSKPRATTPAVPPAGLPADSSMVLIHAGTFTMGSPTTEPGRGADETRHQVTLTQPFYLNDHTVTQQEWYSVMGWNFSTFRGATRPVDSMTWYDCISYCNRLSDAYGLTEAYTVTGAVYADSNITSATVTWNRGASGYRLPTEAEWEYACRAGTSTAFNDGPITSPGCSPVDSCLNLAGWYCGNAGGTTEPVENKRRNAWGLYDMHGNLWQWCWDRWDGSDYANGAVTDPTGPVSGSGQVIRGGGWDDNASVCRSASRGQGNPTGGVDIGFRVARNAP